MPKAKIPRRFKIGIHPYEVFFQRHLIPDENKMGIATHRRQMVLIDPAQAKSEMDSTFIHEAIHIIERFYNLTIGEQDVDRLANGMSELLVNGMGIEFDWSEIPERKERR